MTHRAVSPRAADRPGGLQHWIPVEAEQPDEGRLVSVRVNGKVRHNYYLLHARWYCLDDLNRWAMKTSRYWREDQGWYLELERVESWR